MHRSHSGNAALAAARALLSLVVTLSSSRAASYNSERANFSVPPEIPPEFPAIDLTLPIHAVSPTIVIGGPDALHPTVKPMTLNLNAGKFFDEVNISRGETTLAKVARRYKELGVRYLRLHDYDAEHGHPL